MKMSRVLDRQTDIRSSRNTAKKRPLRASVFSKGTYKVSEYDLRDVDFLRARIDNVL